MRVAVIVMSCVLWVVGGSLWAQTSGTRAGVDPRIELSKRISGSKPEEFRPSPIAGLYEFSRGAQVMYVSEDGKHVIDGDLFDLASEENLSERRRREARLKMLARIPDSQTVVFGGAGAKHTVTVFTDIDCGYCRQLHSQIAKYNELGIRVRYLFYPRSGPETESWDKAVLVWCSSNRNDALTRAKKGETLKNAKCTNNPVARDYELGRDMGVRGTPAIVLPNGDLLPGYVPPAMLAQRLGALAKR